MPFFILPMLIVNSRITYITQIVYLFLFLYYFIFLFTFLLLFITIPVGTCSFDPVKKELVWEVSL